MFQEKTPIPPAIEIAGLLQDELAEHRRSFEATAAMLNRPFMETLDLVESAIRRGGKLLLFGNGGSAADAQHIAAELMIRYATNRPAISALALTTVSPILPATTDSCSPDSPSTPTSMCIKSSDANSALMRRGTTPRFWKRWMTKPNAVRRGPQAEAALASRAP